MNSKRTPLRCARALAVLAITALAIGCSNPTTKDPAAPESGFDLARPGKVLQQVTVGQVDLPKSLQDGSTNTAARRLRARASGDVSTLTSLNLPSLQAQGYQEFRQQIAGETAVKMLIDALKTSTVVKNDTLRVDDVADVGDVLLSMGGGASFTVPQAGKIRTALSEDGSSLSIYWTMSYPNFGAYTGDYSPEPMQNFCNDLTQRVEIPVYFRVNADQSLELYVYSPAIGEMREYDRYDPSSKESVIANSGEGGTTSSFRLVRPEADGSFLIYDSYASSDFNDMSIGYADDNRGGIVRTGSTVWGDGLAHSYLNVEYYDGSGNLIYQGWGNADENSSQWAWFAQSVSYAANLQALGIEKPEAFQLEGVWTYDDVAGWHYKYQISFDGGVNWAAYTPDNPSFNGGTFIFHTPSAGDTSTLIKPQGGDAQYYVSSWTSGLREGTGDWYFRESFYKGFEIPTPETYFGKPYYVQKNYPLKNLLPLAGEYAAGFEVKQKEGQTNYSWLALGSADDWGFDTTPPAAGTYEPESLNSWTNYSYWLENTAYAPPEGGSPNDAGTIDLDKGDVLFSNINEMQVWYWDSVTQSSKYATAPAYYSFMGSLPPYFQTNSSTLSAADTVKAKLEEFYLTKDSMTADSYLGAAFDEFWSSIAPLFPTL